MLSIRHARPRGFVLAVVVLLCGSASAAQQWPAQRGGSGGGDAVLPIGVHLAPGDAADSLVVSWSTVAPAQSVVQYVTEGGVEVQTAGGECTPFASSHSRTVWLHAVRLVGLPLGGVRHTYRAGSDTGWSDDLSFASPPRPWAADAAPLRLLAICDLGVPNVGDTDPRRRAAFDAATADATRSHYDAVLDCGDFGYDMHDEHGARADRFFEMVQPLAATHPFLVSPGNHEQSSNFSAYRARFQMPAAPGSDGLWWSRDVGPVHIVSYSTEVLFWPAFYGETTWRRQYAWLARAPPSPISSPRPALSL